MPTHSRLYRVQVSDVGDQILCNATQVSFGPGLEGSRHRADTPDQSFRQQVRQQIGQFVGVCEPCR